MSSQRVAVAVVVLAVLVGGAVWWVLQGPGDGSAGALPPAPRVTTMDPFRHREVMHQQPNPYASFEQDFSELKAPAEIQPQLDAARLRLANELKIYHRPLRWDFDKASVQDVAKIVQEAIKDTGVQVHTYPELLEKELGDHLRFTIHADLPLEELIDQLRSQSDEELKYFVTAQGLYFGGTATVQQCQWDESVVLAKKRAEPERAEPILDREYRPDFVDANIIAIHRQIREQTGIEVVVDPVVWQSTKVMSWRGDPMPVRTALDKICESFGCVFRVRNGRIFLIAP